MVESLRRAGSGDTRAALLEAAARVFVARGYHGATVREIAEAAGFTNPVLYYHFGGKEELYETAIRTAFTAFEEALRQALSCDADPRGCLEAVARAYLRFGLDDPIRLRLLYAELFRPREDEPDGRVAELRGWVFQEIEGLLERGVAAGAFAISDVPDARRLFVALLSGLLVEQANQPTVPLLDPALARRVVGLFLHGVAGAEAGR